MLKNRNVTKNDTNNSIDDFPEKWNVYKSLWKYKYEIAAAVVVIGVVLGFVVATHGVGALAVGAVAAHYAPSAIAGIAASSVGIAVLTGFFLNKAGNSSKSNKSPIPLPNFLKLLLGTKEKTQDLSKIIERQGLKVDGRVLGDLIDQDKKKDRKLYYDGKNRVEVKDPKDKALIVSEYRKLQQSKQTNINI